MEPDLIAGIVHGAFPPGSETVWNPSEVPPEARFWVIPGHNGPRWLVPRDASAGHTFLRQWRPYTPSSRLKWGFLMAVYRAGRLGSLPGVTGIGIAARNCVAWEHLGCTSEKPPVPVIYVGTPCQTRKAVVGLVDGASGFLAAMGKVPLGAQAPEAICWEADILIRLKEERPGVGPDLVFVDRAKGVAVQEAIDGEPVGRTLSENHIAWLVSLTMPGETISLRSEAERFAKELAALDDVNLETFALMDRVLAELDDHSSLPAVWVHGDMAPWNLKRTASGEIKAFDWEFASPRGLPLFDLVYYRTMQTYLFRERDLFPKSTQRWLLLYMERLGIQTEMLNRIVLACLMEDWLRACSQDDGDRAAFLLRQLDLWAGDTR